MFDKAWVKVHSITRAVCSECLGFCFVSNWLSFTPTVPLLSNMHSKLYFIFFNHVVFLSVMFTSFPYRLQYNVVQLKTSCQLCNFIVNLLFVCLFGQIAALPHFYMKILYVIIIASWLSANCTSLYQRQQVSSACLLLQPQRTLSPSMHQSMKANEWLYFILLKLYINTHTCPWYVVWTEQQW